MSISKVLFGFLLVLGTITAYSQSSAEGAFDKVKSIHVFPNPASEYVHIKLDDLKASDVKLTLHNIIGNEINMEKEEVDQHEIRIKVKDLASGYYLLALRDEQSRFKGTYKFLKR